MKSEESGISIEQFGLPVVVAEETEETIHPEDDYFSNRRLSRML